jgi:hypothetical protein
VSAGVGRGGRPRSSARRAADDKNSDPTASSTRPVNRGASCSQAQSSIRLRDTGRAWRVARAPRRGSRVRCGERERFIETHPSLATARRSGRAAGRGGHCPPARAGPPTSRAPGSEILPRMTLRSICASPKLSSLRPSRIVLTAGLVAVPRAPSRGPIVYLPPDRLSCALVAASASDSAYHEAGAECVRRRLR